ncbi:MAG: WG repeat-containing protein [Clostridia bacterium]
MANNRKYYHKKPKKVDDYNPPFSQEILSKSIDELTIKDDTKALLVGANIATLNDVLKREGKDFYKISTFNKKNLNDVLKAVRIMKLYLKPTPPPEDNVVKDNVVKDNVNNNTDNEINANKFIDKNKNNIGNRNKNNNIQSRQIDKSYKNVKEKPYTCVTLVQRPPRVVVKDEPEIHDIYVKVNKNGKWGFKQRNGKLMSVAPIYEEVFNFKEEMCCVQKDDKFGFINRQGEEIIPIEYECATSFSEGYACVFKHEKCGYIDKENNVIIDYLFDAGTSVINGECRVKKDGKWGELHINMPEEGSVNVNKVELGLKNIRWII